MKITLFKDAYRNIGKRFISFLSIMTIVFIGVGGILGIHSAGFSMKEHVSNYYRAHNYKDFDLISNYGVYESDVQDIKEVEGVLDAEGVISVPGQIYYSDRSDDSLLISATERISVPYAIEGTMPTADGECAVNQRLADKLSLKVGDTVELLISSSRFSQILKKKNFVITAICGHPDYTVIASKNYCVLPLSSFDMSSLSISYTDVFVDADTSGIENMLGKDYARMLYLTEQKLEEKADQMGQERQSTALKELDEEYEKQEKAVYDGLKEVEDKLKAGEKEFNEKVSEGKSKLDDAKKEIELAKEKAKQEINAAAKKIKDGEAEYAAKVVEGERQLAESEASMEKELEYAKWKLFDGFLKLDETEKLLGQKQTEYEEGQYILASFKKQLEDGRKLLDSKEEEYAQYIFLLDLTVSKNSLSSLADSIEGLIPEHAEYKEIIQQKAADFRSAAEIDDALERGNRFLFVYDGLSDGIEGEIRNLADDSLSVSVIRSMVETGNDGKKKIDDAEKLYAEKKKELEYAYDDLDEAKKKLDQGWFSLEQAKRELADGQNELAKKEPEARKKLADAKLEFEKQKEEGAKELEEAKATFASKKAEADKKIAEAEKEYQEGVAKFEAEKADGEEKLKQARQEFEKNKAEAIKKLEDAKNIIEDLKTREIRWLVQNRDTSLDYAQIKSVYEVLANFFLYFTPIYVFLTAIVVFFTIAIIIEEQKTQIGCAKAFGMYKKEIRVKYLLFGLSATVLGLGFGMILALFVEDIFNSTQKDTYVFGRIPNMIDFLPALALVLGTLILVLFVVRLSCERLLSCSAVGLINGSEPRTRTMIRQRKKHRRSVYLSLIINNIRTDIGRVTLSVVIILICTLMMGFGFTARYALNQSVDRQTKDVLHYDMVINVSESSTPKQKNRILELLEGNEYMSIYMDAVILAKDNRQILSEIICVDDYDRFREFFNVLDENEKPIELSDKGVLVTREMALKDNLTDGAEFTAITQNFGISNLTVYDRFTKYFGKSVIMSSSYYEENISKEHVNNAYLVKVKTSDRDELVEKLKQLPAVQSISRTYNLRKDFGALLSLYDKMVYVVIVFSILLAFMVLLNLSNILVLHRMKELLTMRINGFTTGQVIGYLSRETIVTTLLGILLGVALGIPFSAFVVTKLEANGVLFYRHPYPLGWVIAFLISVTFSIVINGIAFNKVRKISLTDITKY